MAHPSTNATSGSPTATGQPVACGVGLGKDRYAYFSTLKKRCKMKTLRTLTPAAAAADKAASIGKASAARSAASVGKAASVGGHASVGKAAAKRIRSIGKQRMPVGKAASVGRHASSFGKAAAMRISSIGKQLMPDRVIKKRRKKPGYRALQEIRQFQKETGLLGRKRPFRGVVIHYNQLDHFAAGAPEPPRLSRKYLLGLQEAWEAYGTKLMERTNRAALHAKRVTVQPKDGLLVQRTRDEVSRTMAEVLADSGVAHYGYL